MAIAMALVLSQYQDEVHKWAESRKVQKLWDAFVESLEDVVMEDIGFPQPLRGWSEDDIAMDLTEYFVGTVIDEYGADWARQARSTEREMS